LSRDGNAKLLDLGLARVQKLETQDGNDQLTRDGLAMGTVAFMSSEQALDARQADERSDIYSLGCTIYYLLVGRAPFERDTSVQVIVAHREEEIPSLCARDDLPASLNAAFCRMVAKNPEDRAQSMKEVQAELLACGVVDETNIPPVPYHTGPADLLPKMPGRRRPLPRWPVGLALVGLTLLAAAVIGALFIPQENSQRDFAEWILRSRGVVEVESEFGTQQFFHGDQLPEETLHVIGVDLTQANVDSIKSLAALTELQWFSAMELSIDEQHFQDFAQLEHLVDLQLPACSIRDEHLKPLAGMKQLRVLDLGDNDITDHGLEQVTQLSNLSILYLNDTNITDVGIGELHRLTDLQELNLAGTRVTEEGLRLLSPLKNLTDLDLQEVKISVAVAESLAELKQLNFLVLDFCEIADEAIGRLQGLPHLESLFLESARLGDGAWAQLATLQHLQQLDIGGTKVTSAGLRELSKLPRLADLWIGDVMLDDESIQAIASFERLELLDLSGTNIGDDDLRKLVALKRLTSLFLGETDVTQAGLEWFEGQSPNCTVELNSFDFLGGEAAFPGRP
jgi:Leucine-rich repeat (LRR) protein